VIFIAEVLVVMKACKKQEEKWNDAELIAQDPVKLLQLLIDWEMSLLGDGQKRKDIEERAEMPWPDYGIAHKNLFIASSRDDPIPPETATPRALTRTKSLNLSQTAVGGSYKACSIPGLQIPKSLEDLPDWNLLRWKVSYLALRFEFINPHPKKMTVAPLAYDFDYADYLASILGYTMAEIVEVPISAWLSLEVLLGLAYVLLLQIGDNLSILSAVAAGGLYLMTFACVALVRKLNWIRDQLVSERMMLISLKRRYKCVKDTLAEIERHWQRGSLDEHLSTLTRSTSGLEGQAAPPKPARPWYLLPAVTLPDEDGSGNGEVHTFQSAFMELFMRRMNEMNAAGFVYDEEHEELPAADVKHSPSGAAPAANEEGLDTPLIASQEGAASEGVVRPRLLSESDYRERPLPPYMVTKQTSTIFWHNGERTCLGRWLLGPPPSKHEQLFWFDRKGPDFIHAFIRLTMILQAIYIPLQCFILFGNSVDRVNAKEDPIEAWQFGALVLFVVCPLLVLIPQMVKLVQQQVHVTNIEMMRKKEFVNAVKVDQKTKKVMRIVHIINRLRNQAQLSKLVDVDGTGIEIDTSKIDPKRKTEVNKIFDYFDKDNSGELDAEELQEFLRSLGEDPSMDMCNKLVDTLDDDESGTIGREEFLGWMILSEKMRKKAESLDEAAEQMWALFLKKPQGMDAAQEAEKQKLDEQELRVEHELIKAMHEACRAKTLEMERKFQEDAVLSPRYQSGMIARCERLQKELDRKLEKAEQELEKQIMGAADKNSITQDEFRERLESLGIVMETDDFRILMHELDPNFYEEIDLDEFKEMLERNGFQP